MLCCNVWKQSNWLKSSPEEEIVMLMDGDIPTRIVCVPIKEDAFPIFSINWMLCGSSSTSSAVKSSTKYFALYCGKFFNVFSTSSSARSSSYFPINGTTTMPSKIGIIGDDSCLTSSFSSRVLSSTSASS